MVVESGAVREVLGKVVNLVACHCVEYSLRCGSLHLLNLLHCFGRDASATCLCAGCQSKREANARECGFLHLTD